MQNSVQTEIISQTQLCERLRHLTQFSSHLLYVSGEKGSGKSTICRAIVDSDLNQKTILLTLRKAIDDTAVRQQILRQIAYDDAFNARLSLVDSLVQLSDQIQHELTISIDDAHYLSEQICDEFVQLVELRQRNKIDFKFNVILFAETEWVDNKMTKSEDSRHIVELEVEPLDPKAALQFVNTLFEQAGYEPAFANQDAIMRQIESCEGNPKALTRCAEAIMKGEVFIPGTVRQTPAAASTEHRSPSWSFYYAGIIGVIMVAGILGSWLYDSYLAEPPLADQPVDIASEQSAPLPPTETLTATTPQSASEPEILAANWDDELPARIDDSITLTEKPRPVDDKQRVVVNDEQVNEIIAQQAKAEQKSPVKTELKQTEFQQGDDQQHSDLSVDEKASFKLTPTAELLSKPAQHYTFQIAGLSKKSLLQRYLTEHQFDRQVWYYKTLRKDKEWYVVLYGEFETVAQANAAKAKLPASVKKASPWMKTFSQVQRDLKKNSAN